jgi:hypothetical protein
MAPESQQHHSSRLMNGSWPSTARKEDYIYALAKPHGLCSGSSGSDMHKQIKNQNRDINHLEAAVEVRQLRLHRRASIRMEAGIRCMQPAIAWRAERLSDAWFFTCIRVAIRSGSRSSLEMGSPPPAELWQRWASPTRQSVTRCRHSRLNSDCNCCHSKLKRCVSSVLQCTSATLQRCT